MAAKQIRLVGITIVFALILVFGFTHALSARAVLAQRPQAAVGTGFTYQGRLNEGGAPADGPYDFEFKLYNHAITGTQVGPTLPLDDLPVANGLFTVELDFGDVFTGAALYLEPAVRPGSSTGAYTPLLPRQPLTAAPFASYARTAGQVPWSGVTGVPPNFGVYSAGAGLALSDTQFSLLPGYRLPQACGLGQVPKWNDAPPGFWICADDNTGASGDFWSLTGNAGTNPLVNFVGTVDPVTLTLGVAGLPVWRAAPAPFSPNILGGGGYNRAAPGAGGVFIGGGGTGAAPNIVFGSFGAVVGGEGNTAVGEATFVGGGRGNLAVGPGSIVAGGFGNAAFAITATISGGQFNFATGNIATVAGGQFNLASGNESVIGGGSHNTVTYTYGTIGGGYNNFNTGYASTIGGGNNITVTGNYGTIAGGWNNAVTDWYGTIGGGVFNLAGYNSTVAGGIRNTAGYSNGFIGGGTGNSTSGPYCTIGGGEDNTVVGWNSTIGGGYSNDNTGFFATIAGGREITVTSNYAAVGGGRENVVSGEAAVIGGGYLNKNYGTYATIAGGREITATGSYAAVGGGWGNIASGEAAVIGGGGGYSFSPVPNTATGDWSTVGGGRSNHATGPAAAVGGGDGNTASGLTGTIPGGSENTASGAYSFAAGAQASATHGGSFVWSSYDPTVSWGDNTFTARAVGGVRFYSASGTSTGVELAAGGTSWGSISDRNVKANFTNIDRQWLLATLADMPVQTWNLNAQPAAMRHVGPVAQDFNGMLAPLFGQVEDPLRINNMDAVGVSLAAIQGLYAQNQGLQAENTALKEQLTGLAERVAALEQGTVARRGGLSLGQVFPWAVAGLLGLAWALRTKGGGQ